MSHITYINRESGQKEREKVYGEIFLKFLYQSPACVKILSYLILPLFARVKFLSYLYGACQKWGLSKRKIKPFIKAYGIDTTEFLDPVDSFRSFNDFFIRELRSECRPIVDNPSIATLPADGRYLVYPTISSNHSFTVKGQNFDMQTLLKSEALAKEYEGGAMAIARLCPVDYHRFHFPCDGAPSTPQKINGPLYSVNPIALAKNINYLAENKREITFIESDHFGKVAFIEVGATYVGTIRQTFDPSKPCKKGDEKGYFEFGGSCIILLFQKGTITFDDDLIAATGQGFETLGLMGQSLGRN